MPAAVMCSDTLSFEVLDVSPLVSEVSEHFHHDHDDDHHHHQHHHQPHQRLPLNFDTLFLVISLATPCQHGGLFPPTIFSALASDPTVRRIDESPPTQQGALDCTAFSALAGAGEVTVQLSSRAGPQPDIAEDMTRLSSEKQDSLHVDPGDDTSSVSSVRASEQAPTMRRGCVRGGLEACCWTAAALDLLLNGCAQVFVCVRACLSVRKRRQEA